jgi:hypothetical protein
VVADPEVAPTLARATRATVVALALGIALLAALPAAPAARGATLVPAATAPTVHGNVSGPSIAATGSNDSYYINGSTTAVNGTLTWSATISGGNATGAQLNPKTGSMPASGPAKIFLLPGSIAQTLTLYILLKSTGTAGSGNGTLNLSKQVQVVVPIVLKTKLVTGPTAGVLAFNVTVDLDGAKVGTVAVPPISASSSYNFTFTYPTTGLSPGTHTFTISLANEHGLVTFPGGATTFSQSFSIAAPPPDTALWGVVGAVAFFGVLFILVSRVAARRRGAARR